MIFQNPLGLLGLIGIPILIIIYILKNKYTEQIVSSTYIWTLSEKFLKIRRPISKIYGLISLILQCLAVLFISLGIAHPILNLANQARDLCFVLDGTGSMNKEVDGISSFDLGKDRIATLINEATDGSTYTLICVSTSSKVVFKDYTSKENALGVLNDLTSSDASTSVLNAFTYAQSLYDNNRSMKVYLISDQNYNTSNIELINVGNEFENYAILDTDYTLTASGLNVFGSLISYGNDATVGLDLYVNGTFVESKSISLTSRESHDFEFNTELTSYSNIRVVINNKDSLSKDNEYIIYNLDEEHHYTTLLVTETPIYIESMIKSIGISSIRSITPAEYNENISGYGLYIFDTYAPSQLPSDGTIWLFNINSNISGTGFTFQNEQVIDNPNGGILELNQNKTAIVKTLTNGLIGNDLVISKYIKYGIYRNFTNLYTYDGSPIIFMGSTEEGNREVVFAFDLHNANIAMSHDFFVLTKNLLEYSFPTIITEAVYTCGDDISINVVSNCKSIRVVSPSMTSQYLDISGTISEYTLSEAGTYKVYVTIGDDVREFNIFVRLPEEESMSSTETLSVSLQGEPEQNYSDGFYDNLAIVFALLALMFVADWMVYCYEQYQLR